MVPRKEATLKKGDLIPLAIDAVAFGGDGVGRYGEMVVFVPYTADGDEGLIEVVELKKRYARGRLKTLTTPSPFRTAPLCAAYGRCGGCQYQHILYDHQLAIKQKQVQDLFARIGKFARIPLADALPSPSPWHYRGKADVHVVRKPDGRGVVGFTRPSSHDVLDIERCEIVGPGINEALSILRQKAQAQKGKWADRRDILWSSPEGPKAPAGYVGRIVKGQELLIPEGGFFQSNRLLAETLLDVVLEMSALTGSETVIDGYCGSGFFSVFLARQARMFYGIESVGDAVRAADRNLKQAGMDQALFYAGDFGDILAEVFVKDGQRVDVLLLDPPRIGLDPGALSAVARLQPSRIVYVSCNPATMARDIRFLVDEGFRLERLQPLDMFPQTGHIEVAALLLRSRVGGP